MAKILPPSDGCDRRFYERYVEQRIGEMDWPQVQALMRLYGVPIGGLVKRLCAARFAEGE